MTSSPTLMSSSFVHGHFTILSCFLLLGDSEDGEIVPPGCEKSDTLMLLMLELLSSLLQVRFEFQTALVVLRFFGKRACFCVLAGCLA